MDIPRPQFLSHYPSSAYVNDTIYGVSDSRPIALAGWNGHPTVEGAERCTPVQYDAHVQPAPYNYPAFPSHFSSFAPQTPQGDYPTDASLVQPTPWSDSFPNGDYRTPPSSVDSTPSEEPTYYSWSSASTAHAVDEPPQSQPSPHDSSPAVPSWPGAEVVFSGPRTRCLEGISFSDHPTHRRDTELYDYEQAYIEAFEAGDQNYTLPTAFTQERTPTPSSGATPSSEATPSSDATLSPYTPSTSYPDRRFSLPDSPGWTRSGPAHDELPQSPKESRQSVPIYRPIPIPASAPTPAYRLPDFPGVIYNGLYQNPAQQFATATPATPATPISPVPSDPPDPHPFCPPLVISSQNDLQITRYFSADGSRLLVSASAEQDDLTREYLEKGADKKPPLACLFCRQRKIACGVVPGAGADKTCNQCLRRKLKCEYPTHSKRGQGAKIRRYSAVGRSSESHP